eukprot:CAMPEP_0173444584 /NCGR_PEP_ID=MMETSP1357-20121228/32527_1 /TAXON_ID=77926 /ORGANISM="Hemiselmis rufescens, Strain PCC563" /LENGTH=147 /DNA_ID=CAMNT_0014410641 /DNA_START=18 /DNA_END=458 /DNA_ORIENTATION=+
MGMRSQDPGASGETAQEGGRQEKSSANQETLPAPLTEEIYQMALQELQDEGSGHLIECVQNWKDRKAPTEDLMACLKTLTGSSVSLKKMFEDQHQGFLAALKLQSYQQQWLRNQSQQQLYQRDRSRMERAWQNQAGAGPKRMAQGMP